MKKIQHISRTAFLALFFTFATVAAFAQAPVQNRIDGIIAKVNNNVILKSDLEFGYQQYVAQLQQQKQQPSPDLRCQILESMLQDKLLLARAEIDSIVVEDAMVTGELERRINYLASQVGGVERLEAYYNKSARQLREDLRKSVREQLVAQRMEQDITAKVSVTPREVQNYFNAIPQDSLPYFSSEVELGQIVKIAQVSKQQKQEARQRLEAIRARILAGEEFAALARQFSQDPGSAANGGELGFFKKRELVPEYEATALKLQPGQISNVIESQYGFHIIQLIEKRGQEFNTRHILIKPATATMDIQASIAELDSVRNLIINDSIAFAKAAKEFSEDKETQNNGGMIISPATGATYTPMDQVDPAIFFSIDTLQVGEITRPITFTTPDGREAVRIIYLKSKTTPHLANLKDDYQRIANAALAQKRAKAVDEWFRKNLNTVYIEIDPAYNDCNVLQLTQ
ncbi:peptidylprolyl isomerase [Pontibacter harenae]|uniref:peptidylprolyl isomerase n=1 Tax=Pontibacter harenae TaxID=2894083 RepID=UPI001E32497E|nr:peptidylprolyl isomerase [Pontibacter harenae]MCC9165938.1 peptidylprolyl isomerase [Pontibacter harenae]